MRWFDTTKPDVVLSTHAEMVVNVFKKRGRKLPNGVKLFLLVNDKLKQGFSGIHLDPAIIGSLAVDMVVGMLHRGETGLPRDPHHVLVPGRWVDTVTKRPEKTVGRRTKATA
jgi:LacI family transcriptional regulator